MTNDLVKRLRSRCEYELIDGYKRIEWEDEDALEAADRIEELEAVFHEADENWSKVAARCERLEKALRQCYDALEVAFDYDGGNDVFGIHHNDAVDASIAAQKLLGIKQ